MELILLLMRIFLFGVFALAGIGKLLDRAGSEKSAKDFGVPANLAKPFAIALPVFELAIAFALMISFTAFAGAIAAIVLMIVFIGVMAYQMTIGKAPDCHCFGQIHSEPVGFSALIRNAVFAILAIFLAIQSQGLHQADVAGTAGLQALLLLGALAVVLLIVAISLMQKFFAGQDQIMKRMMVLELLSGGDSVPVEREDIGSPEDTIPIGSPVPDFEFADTSGKNVKFEHFLFKGKPMLLFLIGPDCGPCKALFSEILEWKKEFEGKLEFIFVSRGEMSDNKEKFGEGVLLQPNKELANLIGAKWTPTMFFINADGNLASHPAVGDDAIKVMIDKLRREADLNKTYLFYYSENSFTKRPKIGEKAAEFELESYDGKTYSNKDLQGKRTLMIAWSLSCSHCLTLVPEIIEWEKSNSDNDTQILIFSGAEKAEHEGLGITSPILLDDKHRAGMKIGLHGTPSAILVDEHGVIQTEVGIGSKNIWALLGGKDQI